MTHRFSPDLWGIVLGGSSGFGLATAQKLASHGMNLIVVHRDRRGSMSRIDPEFDKIRASGVNLVTFNDNALDGEVRGKILDEAARAMGPDGRVRMLLHSIAFGNLKLIAPEPAKENAARRRLAEALGLDETVLAGKIDALFGEGLDALAGVATPPAYPTALLGDEDMALTIYSMGTSFLSWVQAVRERGLFAPDARVLGLTSEGNEVAWRGYAAVAAAKVALESVSRAIAVEFAPYGIRSNIVQAGVTDTPALRLIPGSAHLASQARARNPFGRLTMPSDVASVIYLLSTDEAAWINGSLIRVDGGEHISGASR